MNRMGMLAVVTALLIVFGVRLLAPVSAAEWRDSVDVRISARVLADGRIEFALDQRTRGNWGERLLPERRFFPADAALGQWLVTSAVTLDSVVGENRVRIAARRGTSGRTEATLQTLTAREWMERRPSNRWPFPPDASVGRWYSSAAIPSEPGGAARYRGSEVNGRLLGKTDAPVRIVVFEDFACSFCLAFGRNIIPILEEEFIRGGDISLEFRHMAILGKYSQRAAAASECAADQNLFWPYHDILIANPSAPLRDMARELNTTLGGAGLDLDAFDACVDGGTHTDAVREATARASALLAAMEARLIGVPTFLVNGELWRVGLPSMDDLRAEIARVQAASTSD